MLKKVLSAVLAGVMTLALAVPAFASNPVPGKPSTVTPDSTSAAWYTGANLSSGYYSGDDAGKDGLQGAKFETVYTSETKVPYLEVKIKGNGGLILNPYRVTYTKQNVEWGAAVDPSAAWNLGANVVSSMTSAANNGADGTTTYGAEQIISTDITIESKTVVPVLVGAKVKAEVSQGVANPGSNGVTLSAAEIVAADQGKSVKKVALWLGAGETHDKALKNGRKAIVKNAAGEDTANNIKEWLICSTATVAGATGSQIKWNENQRIYMIPAYTDSTHATAAKTCVLTFGGQMVQQPLNNPWVPGDKITPTLVIDLQVQKNYVMPTIGDFS